MRDVSHLPSDRLNILFSIRTSLKALGCDTFLNVIGNDPEWLNAAFPTWSARDLFPFFLPSSHYEDCPLRAPSSTPDFIATLYNLVTINAVHSDPRSGDLAANGHLIIGVDRGSMYMTIDVNSASGLDVALVDYAAYGSFGFSRSYIFDSGLRADAFFRWIYEEPDAFIRSEPKFDA